MPITNKTERTIQITLFIFTLFSILIDYLRTKNTGGNIIF